MSNIYSMTGFGKGESENEKIKFTVETKTVNNKYCDIIIKIPKYIRIFEDRIRKEVIKKINRGRIEVSISYDVLTDTDINIKANKSLALSYQKAFNDLSEILQIKNITTLDSYIRVPEMFMISKKEECDEEIWNILAAALENSIDRLLIMRKTEGEELYTDILENLNVIEKKTEIICKASDTIVLEFKEKLLGRIEKQFSENHILDENKLYNEIIFYADKADINEEIVRLKSHLIQIKDTLIEGGVIGRKIDFILQEVNREANTIASKSNIINITQNVIEIKNYLEKMREQVQNIE